MENQDNSGKQNAKFLGEKSMVELERDACLSALKALVGVEVWITDRKMKEYFQMIVYTTIRDIEAPPKPCYFMATENGIADIETPPSDN